MRVCGQTRGSSYTSSRTTSSSRASAPATTVASRSCSVRYRNFARSKARSYFLAGSDKEDVVQEGMIGLFKAIRDFDLDTGHPVPGLRRALHLASDPHGHQDG